MYEITARFAVTERTITMHRKTDKQAKTLIKEMRASGWEDIGMRKMTNKEVALFKHNK